MATVSPKPSHVNEQLSTEPPLPEHEFTAPKFPWSIGKVAVTAPSDGDGTGDGDDGGSALARRGFTPLPWPIQAKLEVGAVDDPLEREADRVAEQVMRMPEPSAPLDSTTGESSARLESPTRPMATVQRKCSCGGSCDKCKAGQSDEEHGTVQRQPISSQISKSPSSAGSGMTAPPIVHEVLRSPGQPLDAATRSFFEPRFGYKLSKARIHADAVAGQSALGIKAHAYTAGENIVFAPGQYAPGTPEGNRLIAHELAHFVQQDASVESWQSSTIRRACDPRSVRSATGCTPSSEAMTSPQSSDPFLSKFEVGCDSFLPGEELRVRTIALVAGAAARILGMKVRLDGFASEEGDEKLNNSLSCARALKVGSIFLSAGIKSGDIELFSHGAVVGDRPSHRSVLVRVAAVRGNSQPVPPTPTPVPVPIPQRHDDDFWPHFKPKEPPEPDMWPKFRRPSILDRLKRTLRGLKDALKRGIDILPDLDDLIDEIGDTIITLTLSLVAGEALGDVAGIVEVTKLIGELEKLRQEADALKNTLPKKPSPLPPGAGRGSYDPDYDKPEDPDPKSEPKPERKENKPPSKPKDDGDKPSRHQVRFQLQAGKKELVPSSTILRTRPVTVEEGKRGVDDLMKRATKRWREGCEDAADGMKGTLDGYPPNGVACPPVCGHVVDKLCDRDVKEDAPGGPKRLRIDFNNDAGHNFQS